MKNDEFHEPVMTQEVIEFLGMRQAQPKHIKKQALPASNASQSDAGWYIDATVGTGGHSVEILKNGGKVLGIDLDPKMFEIAQNRLLEACPGFEKEDRFKLKKGNFKDIDLIAKEAGYEKVSGIILDLGVSNIHLMGNGRGFSFKDPEAPLDMRLNPEDQGVSAADLLNVLREDQLAQMFSVTMTYLSAKTLARRVVELRAIKKFEKVGDLTNALEGARAKKGLNLATLPMLALRIAVNLELENLKEGLLKAFDLLEDGGRLIVISFHSKEDEIVKRFFESKREEANILTNNFVAPSLLEIEKNSKSRSARLRVIEKYDKKETRKKD